MKSLGESFVYEVPAEATISGVGGEVIAWRTSVPGLLVGIISRGPLGGVGVLHEASGFGLLDKCFPMACVEATRAKAAEIARTPLDWMQADISRLLDQATTLDDAAFMDFQRTRIFTRPLRSVNEEREALRRFAGILRELRERRARAKRIEAATWN